MSDPKNKNDSDYITEQYKTSLEMLCKHESILNVNYNTNQNLLSRSFFRPMGSSINNINNRPDFLNQKNTKCDIR